MIEILLNCFKVLLILVFIPLEFIIKLICTIITFIIEIIYVLMFPLIKIYRIPRTLKNFCQYSIKIKGGFKLTKYILDLWT